MNSHVLYKCFRHCPALEKNTITAKKIYTNYHYTQNWARTSCLAHYSTFVLF